MPDEYDDGYASAADFERAGADRPEDMEPDEHWTQWQAACLRFGLDESFAYSRMDREHYINQLYEAPTMPNYGIDDILKIACNMQQFGGHFAQALSKALILADSGNRDRLAQAFPELFEKYLKFPNN